MIRIDYLYLCWSGKPSLVFPARKHPAKGFWSGLEGRHIILQEREYSLSSACVCVCVGVVMDAFVKIYCVKHCLIRNEGCGKGLKKVLNESWVMQSFIKFVIRARMGKRVCACVR